MHSCARDRFVAYYRDAHPAVANLQQPLPAARPEHLPGEYGGDGGDLERQLPRGFKGGCGHVQVVGKDG